MMDNLGIIKIELFSSAKHEVANFCCGYESLDKYIKTYAEANASRGLGRTFVAVEENGKEVKGYYTLTASEIAKEKLPKKQTVALH